jgi:hypothetical protein
MEEKIIVLKWFKLIGINLGLYVAGLFGAYVNTNTMKDLKPYERAGLILSGGFCANYITPIFIDWLDMGENTQFGMAFIIGYMGLTSIAYSVEFIKNRLNIKDNKDDN